MDDLFSLAPPDGLQSRWRALRDRNPHVDLSTAAELLDVSEAELVASACGQTALRLCPPFDDLVRSLPLIGRVRAVTRNRYADLETYGVYPAPDAGSAGAVGEIGARFFTQHLAYGYAVDEADALGTQRSLRLFDGRGVVAHEVHAEPDTEWLALGRLVDLFANFDQSAGEEILVASTRVVGPPRAAGLRVRQSVHARPVAPTSLRAVLEAVAREAMDVSIAVASPGVVQRTSGPVRELTTSGPWLVTTTRDSRVRVRAEAVAEAWVVRGPAAEGPSTSLELLDGNAAVVASLGGTRWPGVPEPPAWRDLLDDLRTTF